jgi:hypothetical protein
MGANASDAERVVLRRYAQHRGGHVVEGDVGYGEQGRGEGDQ